MVVARTALLTVCNGVCKAARCLVLLLPQLTTAYMCINGSVFMAAHGELHSQTLLQEPLVTLTQQAKLHSMQLILYKCHVG